MDHNLRGGFPHHNRVPHLPERNYFSAQAMRVGLIGGDRREHVIHSDPLRDELRRELEKQRIREEIIFSEMMRKHDLEAEVRRELAIERHQVLQRGDGFPVMGEPSMWSDPRHAMVPPPRFPPFHRAFDERLPKSRFQKHAGPKRAGFGRVERPKGMGAGSAEKSPLQARAKVESEILPFQQTPAVTEPEELPFQRNPDAAKIIENNKLLLAAKPKSVTANLAGTKRKTTEDGKKLQEWTCDLCKVSATCERSLKMHYQGRKHKANEEKLKKDTAKNTCNSGLGKKNTGGTHKKKKDKRLEKKAKRKLMAPSLRKRRFAFWCEDCLIGCHTEEVMVNHIEGKKHLTRMEELKQIAAGGTTSTVKDENNVKQEDEPEVIDRDGKETFDVKVEPIGQDVATESTNSVDKVVEAEQPETEEAKLEQVGQEEATESTDLVDKVAEAEQPENEEV